MLDTLLEFGVSQSRMCRDLQPGVYLVLKMLNLDFLVVKLIVLLPDCLQQVDDCFFLSFNHLLKRRSYHDGPCFCSFHITRLCSNQNLVN